VFDVDKGLYIGVAFSLLMVIFRSQRARTTVLGNLPGTSVYEDLSICEKAREIERIKIIRFEESIYYANVDNFKYKIIKLSGVDPARAFKSREKRQKRAKKLGAHLSKVGFLLRNYIQNFDKL
jgi:MFS superfamily sulfate permease-like transporter